MNRLIQIFFILILLVINCTVYSQLEKKYWHFGPTAKGFYFDANNNVVITNNSYTPYTGEGCVVVTHPQSGNLMFYSSGERVVDVGHQVMPNGYGLSSNISSFGTAKVAIDPSNCDRYYIFHNTTATESVLYGDLYYSVIDMTLQGNGTMAVPKGDVVSGQKNILLTTSVAEGMEVILKENSRDSWLLVPGNLNSDIKVYSISSSGVSFVYTYNLNNTLTDIRGFRYNNVTNKLAIFSNREYQPSLIIDFDPATGILSGETIIPGTPMGSATNHWQGMFDCEWSSDGTKLYFSKYRSASTGGKLYQYDLNFPLNNPTLIYNVSNDNNYVARGLRLGPDNKIYFMYTNPSGIVQQIGVINNPNVAGAGCNFNATQLNMGSDLGMVHLFPDFFEYKNSLPQQSDTTLNYTDNSCSPGFDTLSINLSSILSDNEGDNISFSLLPGTNGNVSLSGNTIDYSAVTQNGSDTIIVSWCDDYCFPLCDTFRIILSISSSGNGFNLNLPPSLSACQGETLTLDAGISNADYIWSTGDTTQQINVVASGNYIVEVTYNGCSAYDTVNVNFQPLPVINFPDTSSCSSVTYINNDPSVDFTWNGNTTDTFLVSSSSLIFIAAENAFGCISNDTINITINSSPQPDLGNDTSFCPGTAFSITLYAMGYSSVLWPDNSTQDSLTVNTIGTYFVMVTDANGCSGNDTMNIGTYNTSNVNLGPDRESCAFLLAANSSASGYLWNDGSVTSSVMADTTGWYWLTVTDNNGCTDTDSVYLDIIESNGYLGFIPNVFSPNGDGINDEFRISGISDVCSDELHVEIYNRWGQLLFISDDPEFRWEGSFEGKKVPDGVYFVLFKGSFGGADISGRHTVSLFR
ncbi:MAG: gliding motility-associated C-terminal domain-containing protein [Bacteroidota bacterium]